MKESISKLVTREQLPGLREKYSKEGKTIVWSNGCFDLFHEGHILSLESAKKLGDVLVVGLNSDESIRNYKGGDRPIVPQQSRAAVLCAVGCVDHVIMFDGVRCTPELELLHPDIYAQGSDYNIDTIDQNERKAVEDGGGTCAFLPLREGISTSLVVKKIRRNDPEKITSAAFALIRKDDKLLLVANRYVEGIRWGLPGGGHERGEKLADTIVRECKEEINLDVKITAYRGVIERHEPKMNLHLILHLFECTAEDYSKLEPNGKEDIIEAEWFDIEKMEKHPDWILGRKQFASYLADPDNFPSYTYMGPGEE
ncbi:MAG: NUDIX domain-containing protein [Planctomycetes bacterium]|nr:NUDIX domain-containing protein [Planctomycetota bacterium]